MGYEPFPQGEAEVLSSLLIVNHRKGVRGKFSGKIVSQPFPTLFGAFFSLVCLS